MNRPLPASRRATLLSLALLASASAQAGSFLQFNNRPPNQVVHPNGYAGSGGEFTVDVCLDPSLMPLSGNPEQAIRNAIAAFNRNAGVVGNVTNNNAGKVDFESVMLHEMGHCIGMDHNALGPSELGSNDFSNPQLYFAKTTRGGNALFDTGVGADSVRGTRDDSRGDDVSVGWFRKGVNDPWALASGTIDRNTFSVALADLPVGFGFIELATSFSPCNGTQPNSSALRGQPATQNTMFPVLCTNNFVRNPAPDDTSVLRIARAGFDGTQGTADDYTPRLQYVGANASCDLVVQFVNNAGFAFCQTGGNIPGGGNPSGDIVITTAVAKFQNTVDWHFNPTDTTGGGGPQPANLGITMGANTANVRAGESLTYTLNINNAGPSTATNTVVTNPTPDGFEFVSNSGHCTGAFPCALGNLASGAARTITSVFRVAPSHPGGGSINNVANVASDTLDDSSGNNGAMHSATIWGPVADLVVTISDGGATVAAGGTVAYSIGVSNLGPSNASLLVLNYPLPTSTSFVSGIGAGWNCSGNAASVTCTRPALDTGAQAPLTITISVPSNYAGPAQLSSTVTLTSGVNELVSGNNSQSDGTPVLQRVFCHGFEDGTCL